MGERLNRRQFLRLATFTASSTILGTYCKSVSAEYPPTKPLLNPMEWRLIPISSQEGVIEITDAANLVTRYIGLRKLYIAQSAYPILIVIALWNSETNRVYPNATVNPNGLYGFQENNNPFLSNANQKPFRATEQIIPNSKAQQFYARTLDQIRILENGHEQPMSIQVKPRPNPYMQYVFVFEKNVTEINGVPSRPCLLRARFVFAPLMPTNFV